MKKLFIVTSAINVNNEYPLSYSETRSLFSAEQRLQQTIGTINSIVLSTKQEDTDIWLVDASDNYQDYLQYFSAYPNVHFVAVKEHFPEIHQQTLTHPNKSLCESLILSNVLLRYYKNIAFYDYVFKLSGRYFVDFTFDLTTLENTPDKIFVKHPMIHEWQDSWIHDLVDLREQQGNNLLYQYSAVLFAWGRKYQLYFRDHFTAVAAMFDRPSMSHYSLETLNYYFTRPYADDIIETDWCVTGWDGTNGNFLRY